MSEESTIRQEIVLEDRVTPALDSMIQSIRGTSTAMGALLESIERFQDAASNGGFNMHFERTSDAVRSMSEAYESAARHAQELASATGNIQPVPPAAPANQPDVHPADEAPGPAITFASEFGKIRNNISEIISNIQNKLAPLRNRLDNSGFANALRNARQSVTSFCGDVGQRFRGMRESVVRRLEPMTNTVRDAFAHVRQVAGIYMMPLVNIARLTFSKLGEAVRGGLSRVWAAIHDRFGNSGGGTESGGIGGMLGSGFGKLAMIAGGITAAFGGVKGMIDSASERTTQINSLNYMSDSQRNGLKGDEIQDYGVKYANRIGMSGDDFTSQSIKMLKTTDAFGSIGEAMNFNELLQKQLKASGVDAQGASRVTEMYSRGLMKGFDSSELKTIMDEAPALADALAKAAKVSSSSELLSKAGKGKITSQVAKDAIFGNADDIENQFAQTPKTMNELFEKLKNGAAQVLDPISQKITDIANKPEVQAFVDRLIDGMTWFSGVAGEAFEFVTDAIGQIAPYVEEIVTPIQDILFSVWDIVKGLIDDIVEMFTKDEEFGKSAQTIWGEFKIILERLKPIVEGFVEVISGGIKILMGVAKNIVTLYENARTGLHNIFSDDQMEYKSYDTDVFEQGAGQIAGGVKKGIGEAVDLIGDTLTKNLGTGSPLDEIANKIQKGFGMAKDWFNNAFPGRESDRIEAGVTPAKPLHVKQVGKTKIDKESLQLLKDLAQAEIINRVNNIQPSITANFGDVHETADVDAMLERLEKDVVSSRGQNLMLQTGMQYAL